MIIRLLAVLSFAVCITSARAAEIDVAVAHPIFNQGYACAEHGADSLTWDLGDALGTDCFIEKMVEANGRAWPQPYRNNGYRNEDWFGWHQDVLSPCDCVVTELHVNPVTNTPGIMGKDPASIVKLKRADGVIFVVVHFDNPRIKVGDSLTAGQVIGQVGDNGLSRHPHIHIGAYKDKEPLQIRFDQHFIQPMKPASPK
jgi:hypothetical protein